MNYKKLFLVLLLAELAAYRADDIIGAIQKGCVKGYKKYKAKKTKKNPAGFKADGQVEAKLDRIGF